MRKKIFFRFIITATVCFCLSLFLIHQSNADEKNTLVIGVGRDFYDGTDSRSFLHGSTNTWEGLTYIDENMRAIPWLAESWHHSEDGKRWRFRIREGVKFHDGTPMTAADVVASVERIKKQSKYDPADNYRYLISITSDGTRDVIFCLDQPIPYFPKLVAYYSSPVIKPSCVDEKGRITRFIATGQYQVEKIKPGQEIRLSVFKNYWGTQPAYSKVIFKFIPDAQTRMMALISAEIDVVADVGAILPEQAIEFESFPDIVLKQQEVSTTHIMIFNCQRPPFSDLDVRLWFSGILNRKELISAFAKDAGVIAHDPYTGLARDFAFGLIMPCKHPKPIFSLDKNMDREIVILLHGGTLQRWPYLDIAQIVQEKLRLQGISAKIEVREAGAFHEGIKKRNFDLAIQPYTLMTGDPDFFYTYWIASDASRNPGWHNKEADKLIQNARHEMVLSQRQIIYRKLEKIISQHLPLLPLYHDVSLYAYRSNVKHFRMDHFFKPTFLSERSGK